MQGRIVDETTQLDLSVPDVRTVIKHYCSDCGEEVKASYPDWDTRKAYLHCEPCDVYWDRDGRNGFRTPPTSFT